MEIYNNQSLITWWAADGEWGNVEQFDTCIKAIMEIEKMFLKANTEYKEFM